MGFIAPSGTVYPRPDLLLHTLAYNPMRVGFIAHKILRPFMVNKRTDVFGIIPAKEMLKRAKTLRAPGSGYPRIVLKPSQDTYSCKDYGIEGVLPREHKKDYAHLDPERTTALQAAIVKVREHEIRVRDAVHNTTTFPQSGTTGLAVTNEWDDASNATPLADVNTGANHIYNKTGITKDQLTLQIAKKTADDLAVVANVVSRLLIQTQPMAGTLTEQQLTTYFGVKRVIVGGAQADSNDEGQTLDADPIWDPEYALLFAERQTDDIHDAHLGTTFVYDADGSIQEYFPGLASGGDLASVPYGVKYYEDNPNNAEVIQFDFHSDNKLINTDAAFLFSNIKT